MNTIQVAFEKYAKEVEPQNVEELEMGFHAGAGVVLEILKVVAGPGYSKDAGVKMIEGLTEELEIYATTVEHKFDKSGRFKR